MSASSEAKSMERLTAAVNVLFNSNEYFESPNDYEYTRRMYAGGIERYTRRLESIGFKGLDRVVDIGCGYGQWSIALSRLNTRVDSCDAAENRVSFIHDLANELQVRNVSTSICHLPRLPYPDNTFDGAFCYAVINCTPWKESLREIGRILKPGGVLYVTTCDIGWYIYLWEEEHNKVNGYDPKRISADAFNSTLEYDRNRVYDGLGPLIMTKKDVVEELLSANFLDVRVAAEGLTGGGRETSDRFFIEEYCGLPAAYEVMAQKNGG